MERAISHILVVAGHFRLEKGALSVIQRRIDRQDAATISHISVVAYHFRHGKGSTIRGRAEDQQAGHSHATHRWWIQLVDSDLSR